MHYFSQIKHYISKSETYLKRYISYPTDPTLISYLLPISRKHVQKSRSKSFMQKEYLKKSHQRVKTRSKTRINILIKGKSSTKAI